MKNMEREDRLFQSDGDGDHDRPFVEWVNGDDSDYPEGIYVEAVFAGHTHLNRFYHDVNVDNMDGPYCYYTKAPYGETTVSPFIAISKDFSLGTFYIETDTATKEG